MASTYMTPGVYIEEKNAFPNSAVAVETAVPVFIGYTAIAEFKGNTLLKKPTRITSLAEYGERFGGAPKPTFDITTTAPDNVSDETTIKVNNVAWYVNATDADTFYMYNSIKMFYANGGGPCYILSVGYYTDPVKASDFTDNLALLVKENEPTLVVIPDAVGLDGVSAYTDVYPEVLQHCKDMQSRFAILDLKQQTSNSDTGTIITDFRSNVGINNLNYGAAYYPWLKTGVVQKEDLNLDMLKADAFIASFPELTVMTTTYQTSSTAAGISDDAKETLKKNYFQSLKAISPAFVNVLEKVRSILNELPPSGAIAGIYAMVDKSRGVWKAPANVSVNTVYAPSVNISNDEQKDLNVDVNAGKSINVIRAFPGIGTLVWGGRTLDGNSQDWRYINVRRTLIMIEQSIKLATRAYVFEPNDSNTWMTVRCMIDNFLINLWKQGALAGAVPEQAFNVQVGLGATMTGDDILDGKMLITVKVAIVRPAEFIVITFQQQMQQS